MMACAGKAIATACAQAALQGIAATPSRDDRGQQTIVLTRGAWTREVLPHQLAAALADLHQQGSTNQAAASGAVRQWASAPWLAYGSTLGMLEASSSCFWPSRTSLTTTAMPIRAAAQADVAVADYLALLASAKVVNLTDELTTAGVQHLEATGLIAPGRGAEILAM